LVWLPRWGCDGMITSAQKLLMARAGVVSEPNYWDVTTASFVQSKSVTPESRRLNGFFFKPDGLTAWTAQSYNGRVVEYSLSTAFDISTMSPTGNIVTSARASFVEFKPDGNVFYSGDPAFGTIRVSTLTVAWDITTASSVNVGGFSGIDGARFKPDGTKLYTVTNGNVSEYALSTAWDVSTAGSATTLSPTGTGHSGLFFKPDGETVYISADGTDRIYQYSLSTAWDISTASLFGSFYTGSNDPQDVLFTSDGAKMFVSLFAEQINEYDIG